MRDGRTAGRQHCFRTWPAHSMGSSLGWGRVGGCTGTMEGGRHRVAGGAGGSVSPVSVLPPPQPEHLQILLSPSLVICPPGEKALMRLSQLLKFSKNKVIQVRSVFLVHKIAQRFVAQGGQSSSIAITCGFSVWGQRGCSRSHHHIRIPAGQGACMAIPLQGAISRVHSNPTHIPLVRIGS